MSGLEYQPKDLGTRNSRIRELTQKPITAVSEKLHQVFPSLHPDHINLAGIVGTAIGSMMAKRQNFENSTVKKKLLSTAVLGISALMDALDGSLARVIQKEDPAKINTKRGQIQDAIVDRTSEAAMSISRIVSAEDRGDKIGKFFALSSGLTNLLPSLTRAEAERHGKIVPEAGTGLAGLMGTRIGRTATGIITTVFPEFKKIPVQTILDAITTVSNTMTTVDRIRKGKEAQATLSNEKKEEAKAREMILAGLAVLIAGAALAAYTRKKIS